MANFLQYYGYSGILQTDIVQDGGQKCFQQIDFYTRFAILIFSLLLNYYLITQFWKKYFILSSTSSTPFNKIISLLCLVIFIIQSYYKIINRKGLFMLNPCHISLLVISYLLVSNNKYNKMIHFLWKTTLYGALLSFVFPHTKGLQYQFQYILYWIQHAMIIVIGFLALQVKYGRQDDFSLKKNIMGFSVNILYQRIILFPIGYLTTVNLNFVICHSPADIMFQVFGKYYNLFGEVYLSFVAYLTRLFLFLFSWVMLGLRKRLLKSSKQ